MSTIIAPIVAMGQLTIGAKTDTKFHSIPLGLTLRYSLSYQRNIIHLGL